MEISKKDLKTKKLPFFKSGSLVFKESGHALRLSDRHYRCDLDCRVECKEKEPQINAANFERSFSRMATKFGIDKDIAVHLKRTIFKESFCRIATEVFDQTDEVDDYIDITMDAIRKDHELKGKVAPKDVEEIMESFARVQELNRPLLLFSYLIGIVMSFSQPEKENQIGRNLALITKTIWISKEKKILEIELEPWGWYILNYLDAAIPNYLYSLKEAGVVITNSESVPKNLETAITHFSALKGEALHNHSTNPIYDMFAALMAMLKVLTQDDPEAQQKGTVEILQSLLASSAGPQLALTLAPIVTDKITFKPKKKGDRQS